MLKLRLSKRLAEIIIVTCCPVREICDFSSLCLIHLDCAFLEVSFF